MRFFVTGASGFVGSALSSELRRRGMDVRSILRTQQEIDGSSDWRDALQGVSVVIHLAARVHVMHESAADPLAEFRKVNVEGTEHLARSAAAAGVKRLVYVSSIKVNGEETIGGQRYSEVSAPFPTDPYGLSKWEAEQALQRVAAETGLELVVIRPPLVYGMGVKGNFAQMMKALARGLPLPLASIGNQRSLVYVGNLVDAIITCATHPKAVGQTYLIDDGEDVSTPELLRQLGISMGCPARLLRCPIRLLEWLGALMGKSGQVERLVGSLQIDSRKIRHELNWTPPYSLHQGLQKTAEWYRDTHR
jgi:nucleoside-diphosphate-sugar epimerase